MLTTAFPHWSDALRVLAIAGVGSTLILRVLLGTGLAWRLATDVPNARSLHLRPIPRVGGWGVVPVATLLIVFAAPDLAWAAWLALALAAMSQIDDRRGLSARVRFGGHIAAVAALLAAYPADLPLWALPAVALVLLWLVNLYNFMDGADGLAGGMAVFGFGAMAVAAYRAAAAGAAFAPSVGLAAAAVAGAAAGFLLLNFHPAKLFLGDAGSIPLGFLAGALSYWGWTHGVWSAAFPAIVFAPFIFDASLTLSKRLLRGEKFWQAHREHYYQRVVMMGTGHARMALCAYLLMGVGALVGVAAGTGPGYRSWVVAALWYLVLGALALAIDARWRRYQAALSSTRGMRP
ncbi:glycosyl transferase [Burkholderia glumae]|uniref:Glycosyl transferase n=1 Tax=Burkholderia glumae TaxID=337 RepID=A0AAQ0BUL1_BURGL|nr:glycosyl transferase [Burkholderia glumae]ACR27933.1 Glycosyl transferase, family 4 [Burkholderia glumae BGR1]AJY67684.1 glycosyl transferase 4 family protein [Burkholderia glumae LMG 2196 = ATCC 33617]KHJ64016.1 glycosyl transferase [Burkholderia glumae]MCM2481089.1 glycosyl transferase [Burkholderia glumae]MCM2508772.1 glycosyl transferase [Burkholderia glumae]